MRVPLLLNLRGIVSFYRQHPNQPMRELDIQLVEQAMKLLERLQEKESVHDER